MMNTAHLITDHTRQKRAKILSLRKHSIHVECKGSAILDEIAHDKDEIREELMCRA